MKVGELARRTGLTVRTLHYYDELGLVNPAKDARSGHRVYQPEDVSKLQQIVSLRELGFSLDEIREMLLARGSLARTLRAHRDEVARRIDRERELLERLDRVISTLDDGAEPTVEALTETVRSVQAIERHFSPEQRSALRRRADRLGPEGLRQGEEQWTELIAEVRRAVDQGTRPDSDEARALAMRWNALIEAFTGGDPEVEASLRRMYAEEPATARRFGPDPELLEFIRRASDPGEN